MVALRRQMERTGVRGLLYGSELGSRILQKSSVLAALRNHNGWDFSRHRGIINALKADGHIEFIRQIRDDETMHLAVRRYARSTLEGNTEIREVLLVEPISRPLTPQEEARAKVCLQGI